MITATAHKLESYEALFERLAQSTMTNEPSWLGAQRRAAFTRFCETGFPTLDMEDWRFTNVSAIKGQRFQIPADDGHSIVRPTVRSFVPETVACVLVFVNGCFVPELSSLPRLTDGLTVASLSEVIRRSPGALEPHLGRYLDIHRDPFCALNSAFLQDGVYVHARKGVVARGPIYALFVSAGQSGGDPQMTHPRNLIIAEPASQVAIVEDYVSVDDHVSFCNAATELIADEGAVVSHYRLERLNTSSFHTATLRLEQRRDAQVASHAVLLGGALVRNNVHPVLHGEGGGCLINGLFAGFGRQHLDNYMLVEHASPHCESRQFYNGILDDHAHGVFHGRIIVHKDAQKTDAKQTNRNVLLSDYAQIDSKPQLEIFADDVKCTHGATIGQIEENALFYLRSRGIAESAARRLLLLAFASECLDRMSEAAVKQHLDSAIRAHLDQIAAPSSQQPGREEPTAERPVGWEVAR